MKIKSDANLFLASLTPWRHAGLATWKGRAYTVLTLTYGALAIYMVYRMIISKLDRPLDRPRKPSPPPIPRSPSPEPIAQRPTDHYHTWLDSLPPRPSPIYSGGCPVVNLPFKSDLHLMKNFEDDLQAALSQGKIEVENCEQPKDITALRDQMKKVGWSPQHIDFLLPFLSGPKTWSQLAQDAISAIVEYSFKHIPSSDLQFSKIPEFESYGSCFISIRKNWHGIVHISMRYYQLRISDKRPFPIGFRIQFHDEKVILSTEYN